MIFIVRDIQATEDQDIFIVTIEFEGTLHDFFADRKRLHLVQADTDINVINVDKALSSLLHSRLTSAAEFRRFFGLITAFFTNDSSVLPASFEASD